MNLFSRKTISMVFVFFISLIISVSLFASPDTVTVNGTGTVSLKPDTASITLSVITSDPVAATAASENAELMSKVTAAVLEAGVKVEDIATRGYNMYQESQYNSDSRKTEYGNYRVNNELTITVRDITKTGSIIDVALNSGANGLSSVHFFVNDAKDAYKEARILAMQQAREAADALCSAVDKKVVTPISIEEFGNGSVYRNAVAFGGAKLMPALTAGTPITPGDTEITVTVKVVYEMKKNK